MKILFSLGVLILALGLVAAGVWVGFSIKDRALRERLETAGKSLTLGAMFPEARESISKVYFDAGKALREMDGYTWSVPTVPTPFVGTAPKPGRHGNAFINSLQFRSREELPEAKPAGRVRIFLTGGSTAFGVGAPSQDAIIGELLEDALNRQAAPNVSFRVYTFASPSWTTTHERIAIENRLSRLDPDLVVSLSGVNDIYWSRQGRNILWSRTHQEQYFWLLVRAVHRAYGMWDMADAEDRRGEPVPPELVADRLQANLRLAAASLGETPYLYALQPSIYDTSKPLTARESGWRKPEWVDYYRDCLEQIRTRLGRFRDGRLVAADLRGAFPDGASGEEIFLDSAHFGDRGNLYVAEELARRVRRLLASGRAGSRGKAEPQREEREEPEATRPP